MTEPRNPWTVLAFKSIKWKVAAGGVVVAIFAYRWLIRVMVSDYLVLNGMDPLPELPPLNLADVAALVGLPVGGAVADRMKDEGR